MGLLDRGESFVPIHPTAVVDPQAQLDGSVDVGPFCVIDGDVRVSAGCRLYQGVFLTGWTEIGEGCVLHPGVVVGNVPQDVKFGGERSYCRVGRGTVLREYVTVHRGTIPESSTVIGDDCQIMASAHVAHNCQIGNGVTMINAVMLAGHVAVGDGAVIGGGAGVHQFVRIGEGAMIAGHAEVPMDVLPFTLTDREGRIAGLNRIGLQRAEASRADVRELREGLRVLLARGLSLDERNQRLREQMTTPLGMRMVAFAEGDSVRGLAGRSRRANNQA